MAEIREDVRDLFSSEELDEETLEELSKQLDEFEYGDWDFERGCPRN
jgi:hypothetical protein